MAPLGVRDGVVWLVLLAAVFVGGLAAAGLATGRASGVRLVQRGAFGGRARPVAGRRS